MAPEAQLSTVERILFLKSVDLFEPAAIEELGRIATVAEEVDFAAGQTIYRADDPVPAIFVIVTGRAAVRHNGKLLREVGAKHALGALAALDVDAALHDVTALEPVHALKIAAPDFQDLLAANFELVKALIRIVARHVRDGGF